MAEVRGEGGVWEPLVQTSRRNCITARAVRAEARNRDRKYTRLSGCECHPWLYASGWR